MRKLLLASTFLLAASTVCANGLTAAVVPGREPTPPIMAQQPPTNPDPFNSRGAPAAQTQPPVVVPAPQVTVTAPAGDSTQSWVLTSIMGILAALFGINTMKGSGSGKPDIKSFIESDDFRRIVDSAAMKIVQSGLPGQLIGQIPGVGIAEPALRQIVLKVLGERLAAGQAIPMPDGISPGVTTGGLAGQMQASQNILPSLEAIISRIEHLSETLNKRPQQ